MEHQCAGRLDGRQGWHLLLENQISRWYARNLLVVAGRSFSEPRTCCNHSWRDTGSASRCVVTT
jgi:hypothetical protein